VVFLISACVAALSFKSATRKRNAFLLISGALSGLLSALVYIASKEIFDGFDMQHEQGLGWRSGPLSCVLAGCLAGTLAFVLQPLASADFRRGVARSAAESHRPRAPPAAQNGHPGARLVGTLAGDGQPR